ncbi:NUDIX hydrolase [Actinosynnema sp. NPDC023794]
MAGTPTHSVSVAGIVVDDSDRVLVIRRRDNGHWEAPGGVLELAESFEDGVRREIAEESGITVEVERLTGVYKNITRGVVALVFRCRPLTMNTTTTDEASAVRWMTRDEVREHLDPAYAIRVFDAFEQQAQHRIHDGVNLLPS